MAFCIQCGNQVPDGVKFCPTCGAPIAQAPVQQAQNVAQAQETAQAVAQMKQQATTGTFQAAGQTYTAPPVQAAMPQQKKGGSKVGLIIGIAAGGTVLLAGIIVGVVLLFGKLSAPKADGNGNGTALTELLDVTAATYYLDGSAAPTGNSGTSKKDSAEKKQGGSASSDVLGPSGEDSKYLANQFVGSYETASNDHWSVDVPEGWYGSEMGIDGSYSGFTYSYMGNEDGGTVACSIYFDKDYDQSTIDDTMESNKQYSFETSADIDDIEVDGITFKGIEGMQDVLGTKQLSRQYFGLKDGQMICITVGSDDETAADLESPAAWNMVYSIKFK